MDGELESPNSSKKEHKALGYMAAAAVAVMLYIGWDIGVGILLGVLTAFMLEPLHERILRKWRRRWLAQLLCILLAALAMLLGFIAISAVFVTRGSIIVTKLVNSLEPHGSLRAQFGALSDKLKPLGLQLTTLVDNIRHAHSLREVATSVGAYAAGLATTIATETFRGMLSIFFLLLTAGFVLRRGEALERSAERMLPISPRHTRTLIVEFRRVGRAVLLGSVVTGIAQGLCAGLIFLAVGLPEPLFFGMLTAVASLFPGVGTMLVWVPAGIYFLATGQVGRGIIELVASAFVVIGFCDYVLRPRLVGGESMPALLTFIALFGGIEAFGLIGLIVGPLLMSIAVAVLRLYHGEVGAPLIAPDSAPTSPET
jgi:predicted PurR-regulated permease PerM